MKEEKSISIGNIFRIIFMQSKLIILIMTIFIASWFYSFFTSERVFNVESLLIVESTGNKSDLDISSMLSGSGGISDSIDNQVIIYKLRSNIFELIDRLKLNLEAVKAKKNFEYDIDFNRDTKEGIPFNFYLKFDKNTFSIFDNEMRPLYESMKYKERYSYKDFSIQVNSISGHSDGDLVEFRHMNKNDIVNRYSWSIKVTPIKPSNSYLNNGGLLKVSINTSDITKGKLILNTSNKIFIEKSLEAKSEKASKAISFIDERLLSIESILQNDKERLNSFLQLNSTVDVELETQSILTTLSNIQNQITNLELEEAKIDSAYTENNPIYKNIQNQKSVLYKELADIESKINDLPNSQQQYIDLYRNVEISQALYLELVNRKLNYSIIEASTIGNIRVLDEAYKGNLVSPRPFSFFIVSLIGIFFSLCVALLRGIYFTPLSNPAEIRDGGIETNVLGIFPKIDDFDVNEDSQYSQSLESLIINLNLLSEKKISNSKATIVSITSPESGNGKTMNSRNLAIKLASMNYKTVICDFDFKRGDQHKYFNVDTIKGLSDFENKTSNIENLKISQNLYMVPRLSKIKNTFGWVESNRFKKFIKNLSEEFDYIIFDTAPILSVSETSLLVNQSDISLLVVQHDKTKFKELEYCIDNISQMSRKLDGILYNLYTRPKGYYGMYEFYGDPSYKYYAYKYLYASYDYQEEK